MKRMVCHLGKRSYLVVMGHGIRRRVGALCKAAGLRGRVLLVTNRTVGRLYGADVTRSLRQAGFSVTAHLVPDGEQAKSGRELFRLYSALARCGADRSSTVVALGGGVVGDLAGYAASTYMRGINFVNIATTLLAQVDSAIGGKTAINIPEGKNLVGTFYQPRLVISDSEVLKTLPRTIRADALAEVVKYGVIADARLFSFLEEHLERAIAGDERVLAHLVERSSAIKIGVVERDEEERTGLRAILNFGHTIAHGYEAAAGYHRVSHGQAVAMGMMGATQLAVRMTMLSSAVAERIEKLIMRLGVVQGLERLRIRPREVMAFMKRDKKACRGVMTFILPVRIGAVRLVRTVSQRLMAAVIDSLCS